MCAAGALVMEVAKDAVEAALHKQGTYALQKVLESPCRDSEFVQLGQSLMGKALQLVAGEPGIYVMAKLVDQLVSICMAMRTCAHAFGSQSLPEFRHTAARQVPCMRHQAHLSQSQQGCISILVLYVFL